MPYLAFPARITFFGKRFVLKEYEIYARRILFLILITTLTYGSMNKHKRALKEAPWGTQSRNHADFFRFHVFTHCEENRDFKQQRTKIGHFTHPFTFMFIFKTFNQKYIFKNIYVFTDSCRKYWPITQSRRPIGVPL